MRACLKWASEADLPTIGSCRAQGMVALHAHCERGPNAEGVCGCGHTGRLTFDALKLADTTVFIRVATHHRRLVCSKCGRRADEISADWRDVQAPGAGGRGATWGIMPPGGGDLR